MNILATFGEIGLLSILPSGHTRLLIPSFLSCSKTQEKWLAAAAATSRWKGGGGGGATQASRRDLHILPTWLFTRTINLLSLSLSFFRISLSLTQTHSMENLYHPSLIALAWMREKIIPRLRKANFHPRNEKETPFPRMEIVSAGKIDGGGRRRFRTSARAVTVKRRSSVRWRRGDVALSRRRSRRRRRRRQSLMWWPVLWKDSFVNKKNYHRPRHRLSLL